jgi:electron transfer flavoprotein beta subunit
MDVVVCMKQVPDVEGRIVVEKGTVSMQGLLPSYVINPLDLLAIEEALRIRELAGQGQVTLVSLGNSSTEESLRRGIALGADEAILLCDPAFDNSDSFITALLLAKVISTLPHDLVLCGQRADDSQAGQVGAYLAIMLSLPLVQGAVNIEANLAAGKLQVQRKLEKGNREIVECPLPALLTVEAGLNTPRHATIKGVLKSRKQEIIRYDLERLGLSPEDVGVSGSKVRVTHISPPKPKMKGLFVPDSKLSSVDKLKAIMGGGLVQKKSDFLEGDPKNIAAQLVKILKQQKFVPE